MKDELSILACTRIADMAEPPAASTSGRCKRCGMAVWIALSSPRGGRQVWCLQCTFDEMEVQKVEVQPPTDEQIADVKQFWRKDKQ